MKDGKYRVLAPRITIRNKPKAFVLGTLYALETFEVHHVLTTGRFRGKWAWGYAYGHCNRWGWAEIRMEGRSRLASTPYSPPKQSWSGVMEIPFGKFARDKNAIPIDDGKFTRIVLPSGVTHTRLRGNRLHTHYSDKRLRNDAGIFWRYVTQGGNLVMVRRIIDKNKAGSADDVSEWGFVPIKYIPRRPHR